AAGLVTAGEGCEQAPWESSRMRPEERRRKPGLPGRGDGPARLPTRRSLSRRVALKKTTTRREINTFLSTDLADLLDLAKPVSLDLTLGLDLLPPDQLLDRLRRLRRLRAGGCLTALLAGAILRRGRHIARQREDDLVVGRLQLEAARTRVEA